MKIIRTNARVESGGTENNDILYADLLALISSNKLVPNTSYRITDYTTTTAQTNTQSAGNNFDIIVTALSNNKLSEIASCVRKAGDTYFANAKLEAWEIKYCINNDTTRFAWADANGKGVIYYMKDEWGNECPYDFKNIQFRKSGVFLYTFGGATDSSLAGVCHHNTMLDYIVSYVLTLNFNTFGILCSFNTLGTNCNDNTFDNSNHSNTFGSGCQYNTFNSTCQYNTFGNGCHSNTFGKDCWNNTFGDDCNNNTFINDCTHNMFGNDCDNNMFGTDCNNNTFDADCKNNTFGNLCNSNTLGTNCNDNTFGSYCSFNTFGNSCHTNIFGEYCSFNTFVGDCYTNSFGNGCYYNTFGNNCSSNNFYTEASVTTKKNFIRYTVLEDGCRYNNFYSSITTSPASFLQRIRIKGLDNTTPTNTQILLPATNNNYEWLVYYTSSGELKQHFLGYGLVNTEITKETLDENDKVTILDSITGKVVLTDKSNVGGGGSTDIISTNVTNNSGIIVIDTTPNWQRVNISGGGNTLILDYPNGVLPTKNREYLLVINNASTITIMLTLPTLSFVKAGITYNFTNTAGSVPIEAGRSIEVNVVFFFPIPTTCNIRTQISQFI